ncbi:DnaJ protein erdj3b [Castilleja foliolosa]|uniref:DnaJ protein erdj3b n=1 Tax=Castilleja foliolosa TaxID=1961234 RepID=A0ABD3C8C7_9LAMI
MKRRIRNLQKSIMLMKCCRTARREAYMIDMVKMVLNSMRLMVVKFLGGGSTEEEEQVVKGDDVIVELDATLEDLYGGNFEGLEGVIKPAPVKRRCNCRNEVYHKHIGPGMLQQMTEQVCEQCPNAKYEREGEFVTVDIEKGMQDGQEVLFYEDGEPIVDGEPGDLKFRIRTAPHDVFRRESNDLHTTVTITLITSAE